MASKWVQQYITKKTTTTTTQKPKTYELQNNEVKAFVGLTHTQTKSNALKEEAMRQNKTKRQQKHFLLGPHACSASSVPNKV